MDARLKNQMTQPIVSDASAQLNALRRALAGLIDDKGEVTNVTLCALLAGGHLLLEDVPGVGKTTFIKALGKMLGFSFARVQFTSDLLPADILGVEVYDQNKHHFVFHRGPIFTHILLADELNRASPRTQSALLEAMSEGSVTIDHQSHELPRPFMVFATQNPVHSIGTYDLPDSQLDRFAAKLHMGYPSAKRELEILQAAAKDPLVDVPDNLISPAALQELHRSLEQIHVAVAIAQYVKRVVDASRAHPKIRLGISTRGGVLWLRMAKALAMLGGRSFVTPDDLQSLAIPCLAHRIMTHTEAKADTVITTLLNEVDIV
ncbi:MAG: AAA family ATPase [Deltaproteobacteria bacterium]|nr:AAA family ATPase [Deltaproteobacteria bacterium]